MLMCCTDADDRFLYHFPDVTDDRDHTCCSCKAVIKDGEPHALVGGFTGSHLDNDPPIELVMAADLTGIAVSTGDNDHVTGWRDVPDDAFRSLRDQCRAAGVPFFMKQMPGKRPIPDDLQIREFPR